MNLDQIDMKLLSALQTNSRLNSEELSKIAGLSPTACQRRIQKLRANRVIEAEVAIVAPKAVGRPITMIVCVTLARERADIIDSFKRAINTTPEVMNGYYVAGETDFVLIITARSMEDYEEFSRDFFYKNQHIKTFKTLVVMDRVKSGFSVPIDVDDILSAMVIRGVPSVPSPAPA